MDSVLGAFSRLGALVLVLQVACRETQNIYNRKQKPKQDCSVA